MWFSERAPVTMYRVSVISGDSKVPPESTDPLWDHISSISSPGILSATVGYMKGSPLWYGIYVFYSTSKSGSIDLEVSLGGGAPYRPKSKDLKVSLDL